MVFLLCIVLLFGFLRGTALQSTDVVMFATLGDRVTLPCAVSRGSWCSSVSWTKAHSLSKLVKDGRAMVPHITLGTDCSLHISYMKNENATIYTCYNGNKNSSVDLQFLDITENNRSKLELHCYINHYYGLIRPCNRTGLQVKWLAEDNTLLKGERFQIENFSNCFSKLHIKPKKTDHHRQWKCQVSLNGSATAMTSYLTTVTDGIEEVFAAVSQSASFTCSNTSSLVLTETGQTPTSFSNTGSTALIRNVHASNSGKYQCVDEGTLKTIWLHTVDIISETDPKGNNVTLSCVLTCANTTCDEDFSLTWSEDYTPYITSGLLRVNKSLIYNVSIPMVDLGPGDIACSVLREGVRVATKTWRYRNPLLDLAWIAVPIALLCIAVIVLLYRKRKDNKDQENLQTNIGSKHVYENVHDHELQSRREVVTSNDSFYNLLQAVN